MATGTFVGALYDFTTQASSATPSSGDARMYFKTDKLPYFKNDAGTEVAFATLSGGLVLPAAGGTGVANNNSSIITISGAFGTTFTVTALTAVTLPTSGTLYGTATGSITSAQLLASLTDETGTGANVFGTSPTITTSLIPGGISFDLANTVATTLNIGGAATTLNLGAATGTLTVSNTTLAAKAITASTTITGTGIVAGNASGPTFSATNAAQPEYRLTRGAVISSIGLQDTGASIATSAAAGDLVIRSGSGNLYITNSAGGTLIKTSTGAVDVTATLTLTGAATVSTTLGVTGASTLTGGLYPGATATAAALISQASSGAGTTNTYIGNALITAVSDERIKKIIGPTTRDALAIFQALEIFDHTWNDPTDTSENNRNSRGIWTGLSAQQADKHIPWLVNRPRHDGDDDFTWQVDFSYMAPLFVKGFQQIIERLAKLENA